MRPLVTLLLPIAMVPPALGGNISSELSGPRHVFTLTVGNPDTVTRHLTKVGVRSRARGSFGCLTESAALISLADYPISFAVEREETLIDADPEIRLAPGSSAMFTVSIYPNAAGACGPWTSDVSVVVVFDDGTRLETDSRTISDRTVEELRTRNPERDEVLQGLGHRNVDLRLQSLRQLSKVGVDKLTLETKIRLALHDPDRRVRSEAYRQAAAAPLHALIPDLIAQFERISLPDKPEELRQASSAEMLELCRVFASLPAQGAEERLVAVLANPNFVYPEPLGEVLRKIRTSAMPDTLLRAVDSHRAWASAIPDATDARKQALRFDVLLHTVIEYRDVRSVPLLKSLLTRAGNKRTAHVILSRVLTFTSAQHRVQDPFVLAFRDVAQRFLNDPWGDERVNLRKPAMLLRVRTSEDEAEKISLLQAGLRDPSPHVQLAAAQEAAALKLTPLAPEILQRYREADHSFRQYFCNALAALATKCQAQGESP